MTLVDELATRVRALEESAVRVHKAEVVDTSPLLVRVSGAEGIIEAKTLSGWGAGSPSLPVGTLVLVLRWKQDLIVLPGEIIAP
jgi:hypothetical protein